MCPKLCDDPLRGLGTKHNIFHQLNHFKNKINSDDKKLHLWGTFIDFWRLENIVFNLILKTLKMLVSNWILTNNLKLLTKRSALDSNSKLIKMINLKKRILLEL